MAYSPSAPQDFADQLGMQNFIVRLKDMELNRAMRMARHKYPIDTLTHALKLLQMQRNMDPNSRLKYTKLIMEEAPQITLNVVKTKPEDH